MSFSIRLISRRVFLKAVAFSFALVHGMNATNATAIDRLQNDDKIGGYGQGEYGQGEYPARYYRYLPLIAKEEN